MDSKKISRQHLRYICDRSLYWFIKIVGGSVEQGEIITEKLHKPLCDFWQSGNRRAIFMPRGWLKSTCFTKWGAIWRYLQDNESRILIASENENIASRFLTFIEGQVFSNKMLRWLYPELKVISKEWLGAKLPTTGKQPRWSESQCDLPRKGVYSEATITAIGVGGAAQSGHYTDIHIDDLVGKKAMESVTVLEGIFRWQDNTKELLINPNFRDISGSRIKIAGTHWGNGDYGHYVQQEYPEFKWMITPCQRWSELKDADTVYWHQHPDVEEGESNWPESPRYTTEHYNEMKANPQTAMIYWCQHMNCPQMSSELNKFDKSWLKFFRWEERHDGMYIVCLDEPEDSKERAFKLTQLPQYGVLDMGGFKETKLIKKGSVNIQMIGGQPRGSIKKFVTWFWAGKLKEPSNFVDRLVEAHEARRPVFWEIEPYGQHEFIRKYLVEETKNRGKNIRILPIKLKQGDISDNAKHNRITNMIPMVANGELYLHESYKHLIGEIVNYPNSLTIDGLDTLGWMRQLHWSVRPKGSADELNRQQEQRRLQALSGSRTGY